MTHKRYVDLPFLDFTCENLVPPLILGKREKKLKCSHMYTVLLLSNLPLLFMMVAKVTKKTRYCYYCISACFQTCSCKWKDKWDDKLMLFLFLLFSFNRFFKQCCNDINCHNNISHCNSCNSCIGCIAYSLQ